MNDIRCGYTGDREAALVAYLYDDLGVEERGAFERHLGTCARCRTEVAAFGGVRRQLAQWTPQAYAVVPRLSREIGRQLLPSEDASIAVSTDATGDAGPRAAWWRAVPAWAQVAAAMLVFGVAAGIANLDIHYDGQNGLNIRTGWSRPATVANLANPSNLSNQSINDHQANLTNTANLASRDDLAALERQLHDELRAVQQARSATSAAAAAHAGASNETEVLRQVKTLIDQSERRQQNELALRLAALATEVNGARQADLRRIDMSLGRFQDSTGVEVLRNRQKLDFLLQRVAQQQQ